MKKKNVLYWAISCFLFACVLTGCSEDNSEYKSVIPEISDITFDSDVLYEGQKVTATVVQKGTGKLLEKTDYSWVINDSIKKAQTVVYDKQPENPTFGFTIPENTRSLSIKFTASYRPYGGGGCEIPASTSISGGSITYQGNAIKCETTITKTVRVLQKP